MAGVGWSRPDLSGTPEQGSLFPVTTRPPDLSRIRRRLITTVATTFCLGTLVAFVGVGSLIADAQAEQAAGRATGMADLETLAVRRLSVATREQRETVVRLTSIHGTLVDKARKLEAALQTAIAQRDSAQRELQRHTADRPSETAQQQAVEVRTRALQTRVVALQHEHAIALGHAERLRSRIAELERSLVNAYAQRELSAGRLRSWVVEQSRTIEGILARAGVELENLLERADDSGEGIGGPLRPAEDMDTVAHLDTGEPALRRVMASLPLAEPMEDYRIMSEFGHRRDPINGRRAMHEGIDLSGDRGERIRATQAGKVTHAGREGAYGISVVVDHGMGITTRFAHLKSAAVRKGQKVRQGQILGVIGNTGRSTGRHLHYEVRLDERPLDPRPFIDAGRQRVLAARG
jgi:murein DD-endopeptidase MepM/ murein hydrolase activator NlpD